MSSWVMGHVVFDGVFVLWVKVWRLRGGFLGVERLGRGYIILFGVSIG